MTAFNDWSSVPEAIAETVARSRLLDLARRGLGISRTLPESAAIDAAIVEALATANNGPPVVADDAALSTRFPAPLNDQLARVKAAGYDKRWDQAAGAWLTESLTRAAGPVVSILSQPGADPTGATDSRAALASMDAKVAANGRGELDPGTYLINTNITLSSHLSFARGAKLKPANGVTVTIAGTFDAGAWQIFDGSLGGTFVFSKVRQFRPHWFGVVGDAATDDAPALNWMTRTIPDYSRVIFDFFMTCLIRSEWLTAGRRAIRYISETHPFPDGQGATLLWDGPPAQVGRGVNNATITNGSQIVTFARALSRVPQPGERFIYRGPSTPNLNAVVVADAGNSTTQIKVDTVAATPGGTPFTGAGWTLGGVMCSLNSCDHSELCGFAVLAHPTANSLVGQGFAGWINASSTTLNNASTDPAANFQNKVGHMIRILGVGAGGTDFITTIAASAGDGLSCTLQAAPPNGISSAVLTQYIIGPNANSLPALYGVILDLGGINGSTGTNCYITKNLFQSQVNNGFLAVGISLTTQSNQELHEIRWNTFHLADYGGLFHDFFGHCTTVAGNATVTTDVANLVPASAKGFRIRIPGVGASSFTGATINGTHLTTLGETFTPSMVGQPVTVNGAGPAGGNLVTTIAKYTSPSDVTLTAAATTNLSGTATGFACGAILDTYITGYTDNQHFTVATAPVVSASGKVPTIGTFYNDCIEIGASFNAKRIVIENNIFGNFRNAVWVRNGSFQSRANQAEVGEMFFCIDGNSTPCSSLNDDHEAVLRMMGVSDTTKGGSYPVTFESSRLGTLNMICHGGHFMSGQTTGPVRVIGSGFDTQSNGAESTYFEHHGGQWSVQDCLFPNGPAATMAQIIDAVYLKSIGGQFHWRNLRSVSDVPSYEGYYGQEFGTREVVKGAVQSLGGHLYDLSLQNLDDSTNPISTVRANLEFGGGGPSQEAAVLDIGLSQDPALSTGNGTDAVSASGIIFRMPVVPNWKNTSPGKAIAATHVVSPGAASSVTNPIYGHRVEALKVAGVSVPGRPFWAEGANDECLFAGRNYQGAPATAPTDANIGNGQISIYLDEAGNNLKIRVRKSDGTYKTVTVAMV